MTIYNYNRAYSLTIFTPSKSYTKEFGRHLKSEESDNLVEDGNADNPNAVSNNAVVLDTKDNLNPLNISVTSTSSSNSQGSDATNFEITIYNLSEETKNTICSNNNFVIFKAGYKYQEDEDTLPMLFSGQIESYSTEKNGADTITKLICKTGYSPSNSVRVSLSIKPIPKSIAVKQITYQDVFDKLLSIWKQNGVSYDDSTVELKAGVPSSSKYPDEITLENGWSFEGYLKDAMDDVCMCLGYVWYIHNEILYIHPIFYRSLKQALIIDYGLVKSIKEQSVGMKEASTTGGRKGYLVKISLDGRVKTGDYLEIKNNEGVKSMYEVKQIQHSIDYHSSVWDTDIICEELK